MSIKVIYIFQIINIINFLFGCTVDLLKVAFDKFMSIVGSTRLALTESFKPPKTFGGPNMFLSGSSQFPQNIYIYNNIINFERISE